MAAIAGMQIVEIVLAAERNADGHFMRRRKRLEIAACLIAPSAAADDQERLLRLRKQRMELPQGAVVRRDRKRRIGRRIRHLGGVGEHVLGQRQHDRAGTARGRGEEGARDELRNPPRVVDLGHPFRHRPEHQAIVDFLERLALHHVAPDLAQQKDHRRRILKCDMNAGRRIGGAGPARGERDARAARQLAIGVRHHGGAAFMPGVDEPHALALVHAVERGKEALAGHAEHGVGVVQGQLLDQNMATGSKICVHWLVPSS